jgi:predicted  nucleic acid-binding Zn-ribbon protein
MSRSLNVSLVAVIATIGLSACEFHNKADQAKIAELENELDAANARADAAESRLAANSDRIADAAERSADAQEATRDETARAADAADRAALWAH